VLRGPSREKTKGADRRQRTALFVGSVGSKWTHAENAKDAKDAKDAKGPSGADEAVTAVGGRRPEQPPLRVHAKARHCIPEYSLGSAIRPLG
jgi:hypothetical protein